MIYNLIQYLVDAFPDYKDFILREIITPEDYQKFILIIDNGGTFTKVQNLRTDSEFQIITQATDDQTALDLSLDVFDLIGEIYNVILPQSEVKPEAEKVFIAQIKALGRPAPLGNIGNGLYQYQTNYKIIGD